MRLDKLLPRQPFAINGLAGLWELLFIGESIPASANGTNSKRVLWFVLGANEFPHPTGCLTGRLCACGIGSPS